MRPVKLSNVSVMEVQRVRHKTLAHPPLGRKDFSSGGLIHYSGCRVIFLFRKSFFLIADLKGLYWVTKSSIAKLLGRFKERERESELSHDFP